MFKKATRPMTLLVTIIILASLLTISASGSFFYRNAVLGYETQKTMLLNFNLSYTFLLSSLQESSKKYIDMNDETSRDAFLKLAKDYSDEDSINLHFRAISELQSATRVSNRFSGETINMPSFAKYLDFKDQELTDYVVFLNSFDQILSHLSQSVQSKDQNAFADLAYIKNCDSFNYYMIQFTNSYLNRINSYEDQALTLQSIFGVLSLLFSLALAIVGGVAAYFIVVTNRNNSYYRQLFRATVETADFGLSILNDEYKFRYMNNQYRQILNIGAADIMDKSPMEILPKEFTSSIPRPDGSLDGVINSTITIHQFGSPKHINVSRFAIKDENGNTNYVSIIRDFTDMMTMEMQLKDQLAEIEFHSKAKDTFMANISHEIKTPLNAIAGLTYTLNSTDLSKKQKDIVRRIVSSSDLLLNLINDILDLSKIKNSGFNLYPTDILLTNLLSEVEGLATAIIGDKSILWKTEYNYNPELCIKIDKTRLTQILLNLINNAYKFTNEGSIKLSVESLDENLDSATLKFSIEDTGLGMNTEDLGRLFQEFEQLENHLTKQHQGTGLGLTICKNVIEAMGGRIWVESEKDKGSKFSFTIPVTKSSPENFMNSFNAPLLPILDGHGKRVLVVEDNEINYEVTESLLSEVNIVCENAPDGLIALELCEKAPEGYYQLILMDIHMPNMDGYTASKKLKNEMGIKTPILALTATIVDSQVMEEYQGIIDGYIPKPFRYLELYAMLQPYFSSETDSASTAKLNSSSNLEDPFAGRVKAIENLGGMEYLYNKHLKKFRTNYADVYSEVEKSLDDGNLIEARRLVHSVKGLAGTLGLPYLQKISEELEQSILNEEDEMNFFLLEFRKKLDAVCK